MTQTQTAQTTLHHTKITDDARKAALKRIEEIMLAGARAIAASRTPESEYWLQEEHQHDGIRLIWLDHASNTHDKRAPYDHNVNGEHRPTYGVQIVGADRASPEQLADLARVARIHTAMIVRDYTAITNAQVAKLAEEAEAFAGVS